MKSYDNAKKEKETKAHCKEVSYQSLVVVVVSDVLVVCDFSKQCNV